MGKFPDRNQMEPEANSKASMVHFPWFNLGDFLSATAPKASFNAFQASQVNPQPGLVAPLRYISPTAETEKNYESGTERANIRQPKPSKKSSSQNESKVLGPKKPKNSPGSKKKKGQIMDDAKREKNPNISIDITSFDFSGLPSPVCSCTGVARVCYKWGIGGWQSSCCTINVSEYPLPMSSTRPGCRMAGRKMSNGAYGKLLIRLSAAGHDLTHPVDLKNHWARHGTNKFVTIK